MVRNWLVKLGRARPVVAGTPFLAASDATRCVVEGRNRSCQNQAVGG